MLLIRVTLLTLLLLVVYYSAVVMHLLPEGTSTTLREVGLLKAISYRNRVSAPVLAVAGTSKSAHLPEQSFKTDTANLGIHGGVVMSGLTILDRCKQTPKIVLVELNRLSVRATAEPIIVDYLRHPPEGLAEVFFDSRNRPVHVLLTACCKIFPLPERKATKKLKQMIHQIQPNGAETSLSEGDRLAISNISKLIKRRLARLEQRGCKILLFDVPTEAEAVSLADKEADQLLRELFPEPQYTWLPIQPGKFETTDFVHLTDAAAAQYALCLGKELEGRGLTTVPRSKIAGNTPLNDNY